MCTCFPFNLLFGVSEPAKTTRCIRPFTISSVQGKLSMDSRLLRDQNLSKTSKGKRCITTEHIPVTKLKTYVASEMSADLVNRTTIDPKNTETTKIIQNLYITSFGGLQNVKTIKGYKINVLLNATIDLPIVDFPKIETQTLRVPVRYNLSHFHR